MGDIVENAELVRVDQVLGLFVKLEDYGSTFCHISQISD
jgi:predicted RNA-binding protein with RPS1 domain